MKLKSLNNIALYVHIPFCSHKCKYCDFYSVVSGHSKIPQIVEATVKQLHVKMRELNYPNIDTIFIGGGTPSLLPIPQLTSLLEAIKEYAPTPSEWSIESNPESITKDFLNTCKEFGVNRLSIGVQSTNDKLLKTLGRVAKKITVEKALEKVNKYWKIEGSNREFNLDIICSIPGETRADIKADIDFLLKYNPDHISFYSLIVEEDTPLEDEISKGIITELTQSQDEDLWLYGKELLYSYGYNNYEVSNFTKNSSPRPCLHNINYWELKPYLGIGPSAVSTLINKENSIVRITNKSSINDSLTEIPEEVETLSSVEFLGDYIMMGLRLRSGINKKRFLEIFKTNIDDVININNRLIEKNLVESTESHYKLSDTGYNIMNSVLTEILDNLNYPESEELNWFY